MYSIQYTKEIPGTSNKVYVTTQQRTHRDKKHSGKGIGNHATIKKPRDKLQFTLKLRYRVAHRKKTKKQKQNRDE